MRSLLYRLVIARYAEAEGLCVKYLDRNPRDSVKFAHLAKCQIRSKKYEKPPETEKGSRDGH